MQSLIHLRLPLLLKSVALRKRLLQIAARPLCNTGGVAEIALQFYPLILSTETTHQAANLPPLQLPAP